MSRGVVEGDRSVDGKVRFLEAKGLYQNKRVRTALKVNERRRDDSHER